MVAGTGAAISGNVINGVQFVGRLLEETPARELKSMADEIKSSLKNSVICLVATEAGKASVVVAVTDDLTNTKSAVDLVRLGSAALGGSGGGGLYISRLQSEVERSWVRVKVPQMRWKHAQVD